MPNWAVALAALAFGLGEGGEAPAAQPDPLYSAEALDHVLVWTPDIDRTTSALAVRMGFQVRPGGSFPDGVANRLIRFPDNSFLELLYFTKPEPELTGEALEEYSFTQRSGGGANSFALGVADVDLTLEHLSERNFTLSEADPFGYDPDADGPLPTMVLWRTAEFEEPPLTSSNLFFIRYSLPPLAAEQAADQLAFSRHANGAVGLTAVWLLSADISTDQANMERLGFRAGAPVYIPHIQATGVRFQTAREAVLLLEPSGPGTAADAIAARGPHIYGISIAVADLGLAQRIVRRGYGEPVERYQGPVGEAITIPSRAELGFAIELHQAVPQAEP